MQDSGIFFTIRTSFGQVRKFCDAFFTAFGVPNLLALSGLVAKFAKDDNFRG